MTLTIKAISDQHGHIPNDMPACDILLIAGDIFPVSDHSLDFQRRWETEKLYPWLERIPARDIVIVGGNHDFLYEYYMHEELDVVARMPFPLRNKCTYLCKDSAEVQGLVIFGNPYCIGDKNRGWAFTTDEDMMGTIFDDMPSDTDIVISHGPPYGAGDKVDDLTRLGSKAMWKAIQRVAPKAVVCGHVHEDRGVWHKPEGCLIYNVAMRDERYSIRKDNKVIDIVINY